MMASDVVLLLVEHIKKHGDKPMAVMDGMDATFYEVTGIDELEGHIVLEAKGDFLFDASLQMREAMREACRQHEIDKQGNFDIF